MNTKALLFAMIGVSLASCGGGASTPEEVRGTWSDACPTGEIQIDAGAFHILYPSKQDFDLTASEFDGHTLKLTFENDGKKITDVYQYQNNTLMADQVIVDGQTSNGDKRVLNKCS